MLNGSASSAALTRPKANKSSSGIRSTSCAYCGQILTNQIGREPVETGIDGRMRRKYIAGTGDREGVCERKSGVLHIAAGPFEHGERRMPFVEVAHLRLNAERAQQAPAGDTKNQLLFQAQLPDRRHTVRS